jgi:hypothetical protein
MRTSRLPAVLAVVLAGVACSDTLSAPVTTWTAAIAVGNEKTAPTGSSTLAGTASVTATGGGTTAGTLTYTVTLTGTPTSTITGVHIHGGTTAAGAAGTNAAIRVNLCAPTTGTTGAPPLDGRNSATWGTCAAGAQTLTGTVTWASGATNLGGTIATATAGADFITFDQMVTALRANNMYVNVHTTNNGGGEARGQLVVPAAP